MYEKKPGTFIKHIDFLVLDMVLLFISFWGAYIIRHHSFYFYQNSLYITYFIMVILIDFFAVIALREYKNILYRGYLAEFRKVLLNTTVVLMGLLGISFIQKETGQLSRITIVSFYVLSTALLYLGRILRKKYVVNRMRSGDMREVLLVSDLSHARAFLERTSEKRILDFKMNGIAVLEGDSKDQSSETIKELESTYDVPVIARNVSDILEFISKNVVDEIIFFGISSNKEAKKFIEDCEVMGLTVHIVIDELETLTGETTVESMAGIPVVSSTIKLVTGSDILLKRIIDIVGAIVGLVITGIFCIFVGPAIFISDPGPIFFSQKRIGKNGRVFNIYKFRSMYKDAEKRKAELMDKNEMQGLMFKMENDPRIIGSGKDGTKKGIGWFIRTFSIDELPQFWNILKGDMSLVGTRPPTVDEWEQYDMYHRIRMRIKPGLTGLWQVSGRSNITDFDEVVRLDSEYIRSWSLYNDFKIILMTVKVVLGKEGSK